MRTRPRFWIPAAVAAVLVVLGFGASLAAALAMERTERDTHALRGDVSRVIVGNDAGDVRVRTTTDSHVTIRETRHVAMREPDLDAELRDGVLRIDVSCSGFMTFRCWDDLEVLVPETVRSAAIVVDSGDVEVGGLDADEIAIDTDSGDVTARDTRGTLDLQADSGDVIASGVDASTTRAETDSGDIELAFAGAPADVTAEADSGDVQVDVPAGRYRVDVSADSGDTDIAGGIVRDAAAPSRIVASADSGDVEVRSR